MARLTSEALYAAGYALPLYGIDQERQHWGYRDETFVLPADAVQRHELPGLDFRVARIEDVRRASG